MFSKRFVKNIGIFGLSATTSIFTLIACGKGIGDHHGNQTELHQSSDVLPNELLSQLHNLPQITSGLGDTGKDVINPNKPTLVKFWASWCPLCLGTLQETQDWHNDPKFSDFNIVTVVSPNHLGENPTRPFKVWYKV